MWWTFTRRLLPIFRPRGRHPRPGRRRPGPPPGGRPRTVGAPELLRVDATEPMMFSGDETTDLGSDTATLVSDDYDPAASRFTGRIQRVQIDLGKDAAAADHLITAEERLRVAMIGQ
jgi:hypothetical protein